MKKKERTLDLPEAPTLMETKPCKHCKKDLLIRVDEEYCFLCWKDKERWQKKK